MTVTASYRALSVWGGAMNASAWDVSCAGPVGGFYWAIPDTRTPFPCSSHEISNVCTWVSHWPRDSAHIPGAYWATGGFCPRSSQGPSTRELHTVLSKGVRRHDPAPRLSNRGNCTRYFRREYGGMILPTGFQIEGDCTRIFDGWRGEETAHDLF